jgi:hypothetical protein
LQAGRAGQYVRLIKHHGHVRSSGLSSFKI